MRVRKKLQGQHGLNSQSDREREEEGVWAVLVGPGSGRGGNVMYTEGTSRDCKHF